MSKVKGKLQQTCWGLWSVVTRTKTVDIKTLHDTQLKRCLNIFDLTALGLYMFVLCSY